MSQFTRNRRLVNKSEFDVVFKQTNKLATRDLVFLYTPNKIGHSRLGLALSKKMIAKAHDRNRLKRLLRETFRSRDLPAIDIVVLARSGINKNNLNTFALDKAWDRLLVLCE